jgi:hypothetical protein
VFLREAYISPAPGIQRSPQRSTQHNKLAEEVEACGGRQKSVSTEDGAAHGHGGAAA